MNEIEIAVYEVDTSKGTFAFKLYENAERNDYLGRIDGPTPIFAQDPGQLINIVAEEYRHQDKDKVIEHCKERITELGGKITVCRKR